MHPRQVKAIFQSPGALMRYRRTGKPPALIEPRSPLITLLERYSACERLYMRGITLTPKLGYTGHLKFRDAQRLYCWLKPQPRMLETEHWPAEYRRIKEFSKKLSEDDLKSECSSWFTNTK